MTTTYVPGRYRAVILEQGFSRALTDSRYFYLLFRITGRYRDDGVLEECPQYERDYRQYLTTQIGVRILRGDLETLGVQVTTFEQLDPNLDGHVCLAGREVDVTCRHEAFNGRVRERWTITRTTPRLDLADLRELDSQFGALLRGASAQPAPKPVVNPPTDTDQRT
jgi:hypothetical protein